MKYFPLLLAVLAAPAFAAVNVTDVPGPHDLYQGNKRLGSYGTHDQCKAAAAARATTTLTAYECRNVAKVTVQVVAPPKPPNDVQTVPCPAGSIPGSTWTQTRSYTAVPPPDYWAPGPWTPATPPPGTCPLQPPPTTMHGGLPVDESTIPKPQAGVSDVRVTNSGTFPARSAEYPAGQFRTVCYYSHYGYDDPIVHPGEAGTSHLHVFNGNGSTDANSTLDSLMHGTSTCRGGTINRTAYWQPAMFDYVTKRVIPERTSILYYKSAIYTDPTKAHAFPSGFKMVAGNPGASGPMQYGPAHFECSGYAIGNDNTFPYVPDPRGPHTIPSMADCGVGSEIHAVVIFPNCWDGVNLDSPDHRAHMVYNWGPVNGLNIQGCPADHPFEMPTITVKMVYPIMPGDNTANWRLTSDTYDPKLPAGYSLHADWFNAWDPTIMDVWLKNCLQAGNDCQAHMLGDGRVMDEFNGN